MHFNRVFIALYLQFSSFSFTLIEDSFVEDERGHYYKDFCNSFDHDFEMGEKRIFWTPYYKTNRTMRVLCTRTIQAPELHQVKFTISENDRYERGKNCSYERMELIDLEKGTSMYTICHEATPITVLSFGSGVYVKYISDSRTNNSGFQISYQFVEAEICLYNVTTKSGRLTHNDLKAQYKRFAVSHGLYFMCIWLFHLDQGEKIDLAFKKFNVKRTPDCDVTYFEIITWDPYSESEKYCRKPPENLTITARVLDIRFNTDYSAEDEFDIMYNIRNDSDNSTTNDVPTERSSTSILYISAVIIMAVALVLILLLMIRILKNHPESHEDIDLQDL